MTRLIRTIGLATSLGLGAVLLSPSSADAGCHKNPCAPAPKLGCGFKLKMPKLGHGCGLKLPKLGHSHRSRGCETAVPTYQMPVSVMPSAPVPSYQGAPMPGYSSPSMPMPSAPGMMMPRMPGMIPPFM